MNTIPYTAYNEGRITKEQLDYLLTFQNEKTILLWSLLDAFAAKNVLEHQVALLNITTRHPRSQCKGQGFDASSLPESEVPL